MLEDLLDRIDNRCLPLFEDEEEDSPEERLAKVYSDIENISARSAPDKTTQKGEKTGLRKVRRMQRGARTPSEPVLRHQGQIFKVGQMVGGKRQLMGPGFKHVGWMDPKSGDKELWGAGEPEPEYQKRTKRTYVPKPTGWEISWDEPDTGTRTTRFFPIPEGPTEWVQMRDASGELIHVPMRIQMIRDAVTELGQGFKVRVARGKSQHTTSGEPGGKSGLIIPEPKPGEKEAEGPTKDKPLVVSNAEFQALVDQMDVDPATIDKLVRSGYIRIDPD
jgi:hypothetical protein